MILLISKFHHIPRKLNVPLAGLLFKGFADSTNQVLHSWSLPTCFQSDLDYSFLSVSISLLMAPQVGSYISILFIKYFSANNLVFIGI